MSRSGTTLLTTILDSHPDVAMGYEMLPAGLPCSTEMISLLEPLIEAEGDDGEPCGSVLRSRGHKPFGTFVKRCARTAVHPSELVGVLRDLARDGVDEFETLPQRIRISAEVVGIKRARESATCLGFKMNSPSVGTLSEIYPDSSLIYIVRDPRDVVASHIKRGFDRTLEHICAAWNNYLTQFRRLMAAGDARAIIVRYEDLVQHPDQEIKRIIDCCGLSPDGAMRTFFQSKASVHTGGHVNADNLQKDFFTSSIGRWATELSALQVSQIENSCRDLMQEMQYRPVSDTVIPLATDAETHRQRIGKRKILYRDQYETLLAPFCSGYRNITWAEAAGDQLHAGERVLLIRHDVDHDFETALDTARWEASHGLRATYCMLHTAWYYGEFRDGQQYRTREMIDCCLELQRLGHEINLHNNFVVVGLQTGIDPRILLRDELAFLRSHGIVIRGTSTHGDRLCRELDFRNYELFRETVYASRGGPRTVHHDGNSVELGAVSMEDFGLEYEGYDLPRDYYISDSGSRLRVRHNTRGRAGLRRGDLGDFVAYPRIVGVLTHPIWWNMNQDAPVDATLPELEPPRWQHHLSSPAP